jgi:hypothetical protein
MKTVNAFAAALLFGTMFAGNASASSIIELGSEPSASSPSIVHLGDPDPCADNACGTDKEVAAVGTKKDSNAALIDAFGMPTNMPVIMRPSMDTPSAPAASASAPAAPAPTAQAEPQVQQPQAAPAPVVEQPVNVEQQPMQQNGQPIER